MLSNLAAAFFEYVYPYIMSYGVAVSRALGLIIITPAFNRLGLTGMIRASVAVVVTIPIAPLVFNDLAELPEVNALLFAGLLIKETLIGVLIGLVFGVSFWAAEVAGEFIDLQRGSTMSQLIDPLSTTEAGVTATLLTVAMISLYFMVGGFTLIMEGLYGSYQLWPVQSFKPMVDEAGALFVLKLLDRVMYIGVLMISPIVIAILVADIMLAYLSRVAPQIHMFDLSLPIKNLVFTVMMVVYIAFLIPFMVAEIGDAKGLFSTFSAYFVNG